MLCYLRETISFDLKYKLVIDVCMSQNAQHVYDYVDSNYVRDVVDQRFTISYVFMLNEDVTA